MRIYPAVILSSLALVTSLESAAAAAAASTSSPTQSKATLDSYHEHRVRTSGRALRVHERVDKGEHEDEEEDERGLGLVEALEDKLVEGIEGIAKASEAEASKSTLRQVGRLSRLKEDQPTYFDDAYKQEAEIHLDPLFRVPEDPDLLENTRAIKAGIEKQEEFAEFAESVPDVVLSVLADRYDDVSLSLALVGEAHHADAPMYVKNLRDVQTQRLLKTKITPTDLVKRLKFGRENVGENVGKNVEENVENFWKFREDFLEKKNIPYTFDCLAQFLEAYNKGKKTSQQVTVLQALRASGTWESEEALLKYLESRRYSSRVAMDAYKALKAELKAEPSNVVDAVEKH